MGVKFYICSHCGNLVSTIHDSGIPMMCCGQKMEALEPNTVEASVEKHLPALTVEDGSVNANVGTVTHPMEPEHYIQWVYLESENGGIRKDLKPGEDPNVTFNTAEDRPVAVYAYCNLHGLWMTEVE